MTAASVLLLPCDAYSHDTGRKEMMRFQDDTLDAVRDTLMHIAAVSGVAAKRLRHGQSLEVDLGLDDAAFAILADRQHDLCNRLRSDDMSTRIEAKELHDLLVWQVLQLTFERATHQRHAREILVDMIAQAQAELRSGQRR
jgi:hypothetical protein